MCSQKNCDIEQCICSRSERLPNGVAYSASKHAVVEMTKTAALDMQNLELELMLYAHHLQKQKCLALNYLIKFQEISKKLRKKIPMKDLQKLKNKLSYYVALF